LAVAAVAIQRAGKIFAYLVVDAIKWYRIFGRRDDKTEVTISRPRGMPRFNTRTDSPVAITSGTRLAARACRRLPS
jgi:hypothetical protein